MMALKKKKQELLASQVSNLVSDTNENLLRINLSKFFTDLEAEIQKALVDYWNDRLLLQGQVNLILAPIHEKHQEYYDLLMKHKLQEFNHSKKTGERLVKRARDNVALKSTSPVKFTHAPNNLFGTLEYTEDKLANDTFTASEHTLNRVDDNINEILTDGYRQGHGINDVSRRITERFDQLRTWEATRIARTEIHTAQNMGMMSSYESLGVGYTQWTSAHDKRTRMSHRDIDGEIIPFGGTYSNKLKYPGDKSGRIEEWINCRCTNAPYIPPSGMMAPPGKSHFRESDLVPMSVPEPTPITEPEVTVDMDIDNLLGDIFDEYGISETPKTPSKPKAKPKPKPKPKIVIEEPKPKIDIDNVLNDVLGEYGLNKPKTKKKPKKTKTKPKSKPKEQPTITLKEHLRNELPSEFTDEGLDYIVDKVKKRANAKQEYGQIFDYKKGRKTSPEFKGGKSSVSIKEEDWIKPVRQMTREEQLDALSNPQKYKRSYVNGSNNLASIHNHPSDGSRAFSGADIFITCTNKWENYGLAISDKEIWCSEFKGTMSSIEAKDIEKKIDRLFTKSRKQAMKKVMEEYDHLPVSEKRKIESELLKDIFGDNLLDFVNVKNKQWGIKLRRVRYVE